MELRMLPSKKRAAGRVGIASPLELFIFARFHAREGEEDAVAAALRDMLGPVRAEWPFF